MLVAYRCMVENLFLEFTVWVLNLTSNVSQVT